MSSILATMLSMIWGFQNVLLIGLAVYTVGILAMMRIPQR
jgi:hypothetical protein